MNELLLENMCKSDKFLSETEKIVPKFYPNSIKKVNTLPGISKTGKGLHYMIRIITYARNRLLSILANHLVRLSLDKETPLHVCLDKTVNNCGNKIKHFIPQLNIQSLKILMI